MPALCNGFEVAEVAQVMELEVIQTTLHTDTEVLNRLDARDFLLHSATQPPCRCSPVQAQQAINPFPGIDTHPFADASHCSSPSPTPCTGSTDVSYLIS